MSELFIYALLIAGGYYLFTSQSKINPQESQDNPELTEALTALLTNLQNLNQQI